MLFECSPSAAGLTAPQPPPLEWPGIRVAFARVGPGRSRRAAGLALAAAVGGGYYAFQELQVDVPCRGYRNLKPEDSAGESGTTGPAETDSDPGAIA